MDIKDITMISIIFFAVYIFGAIVMGLCLKECKNKKD
jgi:hypothetical protein